MIVTESRTRSLNGTTQTGPVLERAILDDVRAYVWRHGRRKTAEDFGVSRHTLWRFLERGHLGARSALRCPERRRRELRGA